MTIGKQLEGVGRDKKGWRRFEGGNFEMGFGRDEEGTQSFLWALHIRRKM